MWAHGCQKIYGLGESLGASVLIQASAVEGVFAAVVAECPFVGLREEASYRLRGLLRLSTYLAGPISGIKIDSGLLYARVVDGLDLRQVSPVASTARSSTTVCGEATLCHHLAQPNCGKCKKLRSTPQDGLRLA